MSDLAKRLTDLWEIPEEDRNKGIKLLSKIYNNILNNPNDPKFRDLNFSKIRKKLDKCRPAFYLLFTAGFSQSVDGTRLQWQNNKITQKLLSDANAGLIAKINGEDVDDSGEYGAIVDPSNTSIMKDRDMMVKRKKKEKKKEEAQLQKDLQKIEQMETDNTNTNTNDNDNDGGDAGDVDDEEMQKAMKMSMEQDNDNDDNANNEDKDKDKEATGDNDGDDVAMEDKDKNKDSKDVSDQLKDAGLSQEDLDLIQQIKAAKGISVTLVKIEYAMHILFTLALIFIYYCD